MKKITIIMGFMLMICTASFAQNNDESQVRDVLSKQVSGWNNGNLTSFMQGYWQNDSLKFIGKSGITYGWRETLKNYAKNYPDTAAMGKLSFDIIEVKKLSPLYVFVIGKWTLVRTPGDLSGHFSLLLKKIKNQWLIITDHSS